MIYRIGFNLQASHELTRDEVRQRVKHALEREELATGQVYVEDNETYPEDHSIAVRER